MGAAETYRKSQRDVRARLRQIGKAIDGHAERQRANSRDYGFAGDLSHVAHLLDQVERFIGLEE